MAGWRRFKLIQCEGLNTNDFEPKTLDELLDDELVFTAPCGQVLSKRDDLSAHHQKLFRLDKLDLYESRGHAIGEMILITTKASLVGYFGVAGINGAFACTRLWHWHGSCWRVVGGHAALIK